MKKKIRLFIYKCSRKCSMVINIRGFDNPNSPIPNCRLLLTKNKNFFLISEKSKIKKLNKRKKN